MKPSEIEKIIEESGPIGSTKRLETIARLDLGERSEAAKRVIKKRARTLQLVSMGFEPSVAVRISTHEL